MPDTLFCRKCGLRRNAKASAAATPSQSRALVITPEEIERRVTEKTAAAVKAQVSAATARLTADITARLNKELGETLLAEWKGKVDVQVERAETLAVRANAAEAALKASNDNFAVKVAEDEAKVASIK